MTDNQRSVPEVDFADFLSGVAPLQARQIPVAWDRRSPSGGGYVESYLVLPSIQLYCSGDTCNGQRSFDPKKELAYLGGDSVCDVVVSYACRNCQGSEKTFALKVGKDKEPAALIVKIGEFPRFGDPLPTKLRRLAGSEVDFLDKGYRAERDGLGIAAFAYYRRVVESMKVRLIDEIIKASRMLDASSDVVADLERAKNETRFTQAVETIKHGIPQALYINGHSPLVLLHDALSDHLHGKTDEECLDLARIIRVLLAELSEKLASVFADKKEVESALNKLLQMKAARQPKS